jgi:hypothetical protein
MSYEDRAGLLDVMLAVSRTEVVFDVVEGS